MSANGFGTGAAWWDDWQVKVPASRVAADTALLPLPGPAVLITALAPDGLALRRQFDTGIAAVEAWRHQTRS